MIVPCSKDYSRIFLARFGWGQGSSKYPIFLDWVAKDRDKAIDTVVAGQKRPRRKLRWEHCRPSSEVWKMVTRTEGSVLPIMGRPKSCLPRTIPTESKSLHRETSVASDVVPTTAPRSGRIGGQAVGCQVHLATRGRRIADSCPISPMECTLSKE